MIQTDETRHSPKGRIITFYSYKGGTGRSMALANIAWILAFHGEKVLVIDWDLEAPGVYRYFHPFLVDKELLETEGLLDFLMTIAGRAVSTLEPLKEEEVDIIQYVTVLKWPAGSPVGWETFGPNAGIDLLVAGRQGPSYSSSLNAFNWVDFYERMSGRRLLEIAREQLRDVYDYVLIDSRTGVSDTSGICTIEMPDSLVVCFTLNDQSINGASGVAKSVLLQREARTNTGVHKLPSDRNSPRSSLPEFQIFPVPTRVEITSERLKREIAMTLAQERFSAFVSGDLRSKYWGRVQLPYFPFYAFEEIPAVFGDPAEEEFSLTTPLKQITRFLTGDPSIELPPLHIDREQAEKVRKEILSWYLRKDKGATLDPLHIVQMTYEHLEPQDQMLMQQLMLRLVQITPNRPPTPAVVSREDLDLSFRDIITSLTTAGVLEELSASICIADRKIVENWDRLQQWINEDRGFLAWRQNLTLSAHLWRLEGENDSELLQGKRLEEALSWFRDRSDDLDQNERRFVIRSRDRQSARESSVAPSKYILMGVGAILCLAGLWAVLSYRNFVQTRDARFAAIVSLAQKYTDTDPLTSVLLLSEVQDYDATEPDRKFALQSAAKDYPEVVIRGNGPFLDLDVARDGKLIAAATANGIEIRATDRWNNISTIAGASRILSASFNGWGAKANKPGAPDRLVSVSDAGRVLIWDLDGNQLEDRTTYVFRRDGSRRGTLHKPLYASKARFVGGTSNIVLTYPNSSVVKIPFMPNRRQSASLAKPADSTSPAVSSDGRLAASMSDGQLTVLNVQNWTRKVNTFKGYTGPFAISTHEDVVANFPSELLVISLLRSPYLRTINLSEAVNRAALSPDGKIAAAASNQRVLWWFLDKPQEHLLIGHSGYINAITFNSAGTLILTASDDKTIRIWPTQRRLPNPTLSWPELITYLRNSTHACLTVDQRMQLLNETKSVAEPKVHACENRS